MAPAENPCITTPKKRMFTRCNLEKGESRGMASEDPVKRTCDVCGKDAIGMQTLGCCSSTVCEEHAESQLREMRPGEKKEWGICYFVRFGEPVREQ